MVICNHLFQSSLQTCHLISAPRMKPILSKKLLWPFFALSVFLQSVEKMPSVQSFVATSSRPNIWGAVIALGFMRISLCGWPHSGRRNTLRDINSYICKASISKCIKTQRCTRKTMTCTMICEVILFLGSVGAISSVIDYLMFLSLKIVLSGSKFGISVSCCRMNLWPVRCLPDGTALWIRI